MCDEKHGVDVIKFYEECSRRKDTQSSKDTTKSILVFRSLEEGDREGIKALHEDLFPVKYSEDFYDNAVRNKSPTGSPLYCRVGLLNVYESGSNNDTLTLLNNENEMNDNARRIDIVGDSTHVSMDELANFLGMDVDCFDDLDVENVISIQNEKSIEDAAESALNQRIVACIIGGFSESIRIRDAKLVEKLVRNFDNHPHMFYLMTIGSTQAFREQKLGTKMLKDCLKMIERVPTCGVVYLHVITYNVAAIKFYEKLGFYRIEEIKGMFENIFLYLSASFRSQSLMKTSLLYRLLQH